MTVTIGEWRLVPYDKRNWTLEHWHSSTKTNQHAKAGGEPKWHSCGEYFQSIGMALNRIFEYVLRDDPSSFDADQLREMVGHVEDVARGLRETVVVSE